MRSMPAIETRLSTRSAFDDLVYQYGGLGYQGSGICVWSVIFTQTKAVQPTLLHFT